MGCDYYLAGVAQEEQIRELRLKLQFLVDYMDKEGLLEDSSFTFPDGTIIRSNLPAE